MISKNTICLWYDGIALDAANFYAKAFPDSGLGTVTRAPGDYPDGKQGDVLTVEFTVAGVPCIGPNGGPQFKQRPRRHASARAASSFNPPITVSVAWPWRARARLCSDGCSLNPRSRCVCVMVLTQNSAFAQLARR